MVRQTFLTGGAETGALLRLHDWRSSPLGDPKTWPECLKALVRVMLASDQAMLIAWGEDLVCLYNDAHALLVGTRHPAMLGRPLFEAWGDVAQQFEPYFRRAMQGEAGRLDDVVTTVVREGRPLAAHFAVSYTPIYDGDAIGGVLCVSSETTDRVVDAWRRAALLELSDRLRTLNEPRAIVDAAVETLGRCLKANRVGYGEVQPGGETILLETSYVDGVAPLHGVFALEGFGRENIDLQRRGVTVARDDVLASDAGQDTNWAAIDTRSFASAPLIRDGRLRASLYVNFREPHPWSAMETWLLEEVAARVWDALERARAEAALKQSEGRFRAAVSAVAGILWTNNAKGEMEGEQAGWAALTGQPLQDYQGFGWANAVHPDDAQATLNAWRKAVADGRDFHFEHRVRRHDGVWRVCMVRATPILADNGAIVEWVGVHTDITEQRTAEQYLQQLNASLRDRVAAERRLNQLLVEQGAALDEAQGRLRTIFNASSEGLTLCRVVRNAEGRVVDYQVLDVNPAHSVLTGATREQMLATTVSRIAPPVDPRWFKSADDAVNLGLPRSFEVRSRATGRWLDIHVSPVSGDLFAQTFIDISAKKQVEEQRVRFLAEMNHRVKNNFQMVASVLDLQARRASNAETRDQLRTAVQRVHLLAELHESLALSPDAGAVDFQSYLGAICERLRRSIDEPDRIRLSLLASPATLNVAQAVPLGFVVNELVTNSIKYAFQAPQAGEIKVCFECEDAVYVLRIADDGPGLPQAAAPKGTGLGMRLVSAFVKQIGGDIQIRHTPGVEHEIRFPIERA